MLLLWIFFYLLPSLSDKIIIKYVLILTKYVPWLSFWAEMVDDETGGSIFSPDFMPGYQMENLKSRLPSFLYYIFFFLYKSILFNKLFLDFRLLSGSSHIQSVLIGVEYRNHRQILDVYSKQI